MTIMNPEKFMEGIWDWGILDNCFPGGMKVSDIDGFFERKRNFLVFECKSPGVPIPKGQQISFDNMVKTGLFTVILIWGTRNNPQEIQVFYANGKVSKKKPATLEDLRKVVSWWYTQIELYGKIA
jgi:hypothetical protein